MTTNPYEIIILLYPGMTALDAIGPYEALRGIPNAQVRFVARERGLVTVDSQVLKLYADFAIDEITTADMLVIPGGPEVESQTRDQKLMDWIRQIHATSQWTISVCTGAFLLGAAGLLDGLEATTHWAALDRLPSCGAIPLKQRIVRAGKIFTAAGVSAGIDLALVLVALEAGETVAQAMQLVLEYCPEPPFDSGSIETAPEEAITYAQMLLAGNHQQAEKPQGRELASVGS